MLSIIMYTLISDMLNVKTWQLHQQDFIYVRCFHDRDVKYDKMYFIESVLNGVISILTGEL